MCFCFVDENIDQAFAKFMRAHKCYDLIPTSAKLVIFDTQLNVSIHMYISDVNSCRNVQRRWRGIKRMKKWKDLRNVE